MKKLFKHISPSKGFSLMELIVVFAILSVLSTVSIASFVDYSRKQTLDTAVLDVVSMLQTAKSRAQSQVKDSLCSGPLTSYQVVIDPGLNKYTLNMICGSPQIEVESKILPTGVAFLLPSGGLTTTTDVTFQVLTNRITGSGNIGIEAFSNMGKIIEIDSAGNIKMENAPSGTDFSSIAPTPTPTTVIPTPTPTDTPSPTPTDVPFVECAGNGDFCSDSNPCCEGLACVESRWLGSTCQ